ncbi:MAG: tetratricopeptide repeat protein [Planctomycetota bacterium]
MRASLALPCVIIPLLWVSCGGSEGDAASSTRVADIVSFERQHLPIKQLPVLGDQECGQCHADIVRQWKLHGMADTLGALDPERIPAELDGSWLHNQQSNFAYQVKASNDAWKLLAFRDAPAPGWPKFQQARQLPFRIGAGVNAMSFVAESSGRWFFAPIEFYTGQGWEPAPQEFGSTPGGLHHPITGECLSCHSDTRTPDVYPLNALAGFRPEPLSCITCHGAGDAHVDLMKKGEYAQADLHILYPGDLSSELQLDLCARCHLEGDARIEFDLNSPHPAPGERLSEHRAVMVAKEASDDFSFVSQVRRLALSACFQNSPDMTCSSCHNPHLPPRLQDAATRVQKCLNCHADIQPHGNPTAEEDCISCHMPRRKPYDLQAVEISDHKIGIHPDRAKVEHGFRPMESLSGNWEVFRYRPTDGVNLSDLELRALDAMTLAEKGFQERALAQFDTLPSSGSFAGLPVLQLPQFHFLRGRTLTTAGRNSEAQEAYRTALHFAPNMPEAQLNLAWLLVDAGELKEAEMLAQQTAELFPEAEAPWNVLFLIASKRQDSAALGAAATASLERQPDQPRILQALGRMHLASGQLTTARDRLADAYRLDPDLPGLLDDIAEVAARMR